MTRKNIRTGDCVVFRKRKQSVRPGPRAQGICPAPHGDTYAYFVEKLWLVRDVLPEGKVVVQTRRGKTHRLSIDDPNLRTPTLLDRIRYRDRMAQLHVSAHQIDS